MQSLILTADGLQLADTPIPPVMPGHVRMEVRSVGICGTDLAIWRGDYETKLPIVLGHEIAGAVHETSGVDIEPGTLVTTEIDVSCGRCWYCQHNMNHYCQDREILGVTTDGGLSEFITVPAELVHTLPEGVDTDAATFVEPLASAIKTVEAVPVQKEEMVLVLGSGKIALLLAQVYDAAGADVHIVGRNRWQLGLARQLGLMNTYDVNSSSWKEKILDETSGVGPRVVVEATGNIDGFNIALELVRNGGVIALKSMHGCQYSLDPTDIVNRELTVFGTSRGPFDKAIAMLNRGRIEVKRLISKEFKLEDGANAFEYASQPSVTKVMINI
ncbi:MAG: hypothetical protein DRO87_08745 [Candidatus Thorarchaeota archaeon]|nr:MAG: hypothetical protein DRO87_08745 [Candidatus Thorarchaeota archaeon]RLI55661.1 MAG: hypothetical protein DRP09_08985 [Candidatus Thorarchaeota archaeon]